MWRFPLLSFIVTLLKVWVLSECIRHLEHLFNNTKYLWAYFCFVFEDCERTLYPLDEFWFSVPSIHRVRAETPPTRPQFKTVIVAGRETENRALGWRYGVKRVHISPGFVSSTGSPDDSHTSCTTVHCRGVVTDHDPPYGLQSSESRGLAFARYGVFLTLTCPFHYVWEVKLRP